AGTLTFAPGETSHTVTVSVNGDTTFEPDETFTHQQTTRVNSTIVDISYVGTSTNDDAQPAISVTDVTANEGNSLTTPFTFTVSLANASYHSVTGYYATRDVHSFPTRRSSDLAGTLTFAPGETSHTVTVSVNGDTTFEPDETF